MCSAPYRVPFLCLNFLPYLFQTLADLTGPAASGRSEIHSHRDHVAVAGRAWSGLVPSYAGGQWSLRGWWSGSPGDVFGYALAPPWLKNSQASFPATRDTCLKPFSRPGILLLGAVATLVTTAPAPLPASVLLTRRHITRGVVFSTL